MTDNTQETEHDPTAELDGIARDAAASSDTEYIPGAEASAAESGADPNEPDPQTVEACQTAAVVVCEILASRRGAHWRLKEDEAQALADPAARCVEKYLPDVAVGPELSLAMALGGIALPRLMADRQAEQERQAQAERESETAGQGDPDNEGEGDGG